MAKYTFIATGDVGPNRENPDEMFDQVRDVLHSADLVFGQLEPCIAASGSPACQPRLPMRCRPEMAEAIAPLEHLRWVRDHEKMGWSAGSRYETLLPDADESARAALREQLRMHRDTLPPGSSDKTILHHYSTLPPDVQGKDSLPFNSLLRLLKKYDGVRIYRLK